MSSQCSKGVLLWQAVPQLVGGRGQVNHTASPPIGKLEELSAKTAGLGGCIHFMSTGLILGGGGGRLCNCLN